MMKTLNSVREEIDSEDSYIVYRRDTFPRRRKIKLFHVSEFSEPSPFTIEPGNCKSISGLGKNVWFVMTDEGKLMSVLKADREGYVDLYKKLNLFNDA